MRARITARALAVVALAVLLAGSWTVASQQRPLPDKTFSASGRGTFGELLRAIGTAAGVSIRLGDGVEALEIVQRQVGWNVHDGVFSRVFPSLLQAANLTYVVSDDGSVLIVPATAAEPPR